MPSRSAVRVMRRPHVPPTAVRASRGLAVVGLTLGLVACSDEPTPYHVTPDADADVATDIASDAEPDAPPDTAVDADVTEDPWTDTVGDTDGDTPGDTIGDTPGDTPADVELDGDAGGAPTLAAVHAQWVLGDRLVVVELEGTDGGADVDTLLVDVMAGETVISAGIEVDIADAVAFDGDDFLASTELDGTSWSEWDVTLVVAVRDAAGGLSGSVSESVERPSALGESCLVPVSELSTCVPGGWCFGESPLGTCNTAEGDAPVLAAAGWGSVEPSSATCGVSAPHRIELRLEGETDLPVRRVNVAGGPRPVVPIHAGAFDVTISACYGELNLGEPTEIAVVDVAGRVSNGMVIVYDGSLDVDAPCPLELVGLCGAGSYCDPDTLACAALPDVDGVSCGRPVAIGDDVARLADATLVDAFDGTACFGDAFETAGADRVYALELGAGESVSAIARPLEDADLALYLIDSCTRTPREGCLAAARNADLAEETLVFENASDVARTVYLVVDALGSAPSDDGVPFQLTVARSATGLVCPGDDVCDLAGGRKLGLVLVLDNSTSMNTVVADSTTRWDVLVSGVHSVLEANAGLLAANAYISVMRFGHDPVPESEGTLIPSEPTGIVDGQKVDMLWSAPDDLPDTYRACFGDEALAQLDATVPPMNGMVFGIGTWTKGALDHAAALIAQSRADHPADGGDRDYVVLLVTDGAWTGIDGTTTLSPASENPAISAASLFDDAGVPTYVVEISGDPQALSAANEVAAEGGTGAAFRDFGAAANAIAGRCLALE